MEDKLKNVLNDYNRHAAENIPSIFCTVMLWAGAQSLINDAAKTYLPNMPIWQISAVEIFFASYGLWYISRQKNGKMTNGISTNETATDGTLTPPETKEAST